MTRANHASRCSSGGAHAVRVHAVGADAPFGLEHLLLVAQQLALAEEFELVALGVLEQRHDDLAGDVAAHHDHAGAVGGGGVQELAPEVLGAVDVGGVVEARRRAAGACCGAAAACRRAVVRRCGAARVRAGGGGIGACAGGGAVGGGAAAASEAAQAHSGGSSR
jgi:hypothetical protein